VTGRFEVRRGDPLTLASSVVQTTDVLIVGEPVAIDTLALGGEPTRRAALASVAAVLLLPRSGLPRHGPVVAVAASQSDRCFELAAGIAAATDDQAFAIPPAASSAGLLGSLQRVLGSRHERLLVLPREATMPNAVLLQVAARHKTPILVLAS
jgi:hypothetical protein